MIRYLISPSFILMVNSHKSDRIAILPSKILRWFFPTLVRCQARRFPVPNRGCRLYPHRHQCRAPFPNRFPVQYRSRYLHQFRSQFPTRCRKPSPLQFLRQCRNLFLRQSLNLCRLCFSRSRNLRLFVRSIAKTGFSKVPNHFVEYQTWKNSVFA